MFKKSWSNSCRHQWHIILGSEKEAEEEEGEKDGEEERNVVWCVSRRTKAGSNPAVITVWLVKGGLFLGSGDWARGSRII